MNIDCTKWRELASDYIEGSLPAEMNSAVTAHLRTCAPCRQDEIALRAITRELNVLPEVDPPLYFRENVMTAIERKGNRPAGNWWEVLFAQYGRLAVGSTLAIAAVGALGFTVLLPLTAPRNLSGGIVPAPSPISTPAPANTSVKSPDLKISRVTTVLPGEDASWDFSFHLENAENGTARFKVGSGDKIYRFPLSGNSPQTLRVPPSVLSENKKVLDVQAVWTADQASHERFLMIPIAGEGESAPDVRQSFGLPEENIVDAIRELSARYGQEIILDDVPTDLMVRLTARDESVEDTLRRQLGDYGLAVTKTNEGLRISRSGGMSVQKP